MKKTTTFRQNALVGAPGMASGFTPSILNASTLSVSLRNVDIKIYGFTGSQWELLHNTDGVVNTYVTDVVHQKYYLESKTNAEQVVRMSFISSDVRNIEQPRFGVSKETRKLHDIDEVPIYTAADVEKMLTVMSNGSLAWLLANESFIVPSEGEDSGGVVGLEEDSGLTLHGNAQLVGGVLSLDGTPGTYASLPSSSDFDRESGDLTINMWIKANSLPSNWNAGLVSKMGNGWDGYITAISTMQADAGGNMTSGGLQTTSWVGGSNPTANNRAAPSGGISLDTWHHVAYVMPSTGNYKMYFNGQEVHSYAPTARNTSTSGDLRIGGWQNGSYSGFFDGYIDGVSIQKTALSASDISSLHSGGPEPSSSPVVTGTFLEELASASNNLFRGALITNNVFVKPTNNAATWVSLESDGIIDFNADGTRTEEEMTLSMWFNPDNTDWTGWRYIAGNAADSNNEFRLAAFKNQSGNIQFNTILWDLWTGSPKGISSKPFVAGEWTHFAMTWSHNGSTYDLKLFVDGVKCGELLNQNRNLMKMVSNRNFGIGGIALGGGVSSVALPCSMDSVQIKSGTALTDSQVAAIAGQSDRQMSIETAAGSGAPVEPSYLESDATLYGDANLSNGSLVLDGTGDYGVIDDGFRFTDKMTTSVWFKTTATGDRRIYSSHVRGMGGADFRNGFFARLNNGQLKYRHPAGGTGELTGPSGLNDGAWHHLALSWEASVGYTLYVDGSQISSGGSGTSDGYVSGWGLYIGANPWNRTSQEPYAFFDGEIRNFEIENEVLTAEQIESKYDDGAPFTPTGTGSFLEDFTMFGGGTVTDGVLSTSAASPSYYKKSGMTAPSTTATTAVFSMWFNPEQSQMGLYSDQHYPSQVDFGLRMFSSSLLHISTPVGGANGVTLATPLTLNEWHHALVTVETDIAYTSTSSKSMTVKLFIDGEEVYTKTGNSSTKRIRAYAGIANGTKHYIGAENYNGSVSYKGDGQFDFMEWVDDVTLSDAQILAMYNGGTRGWSVADADNYTP